MDKRFWISGAVMAVAALALGYLVHGVLLAPDYNPLVGTVMRSPEEASPLMGWMLLADVCIGFAMTWLYRQGADAGKPVLGQGLRFGLAIAFVSVVPTFLIYYVVDRLPGALPPKQVLFDTARFLLLGVLVAYLNPRRAAG